MHRLYTRKAQLNHFLGQPTESSLVIDLKANVARVYGYCFHDVILTKQIVVIELIITTL